MIPKHILNKLNQVNKPEINLSEIDISELNITVFGMRGSGKSTFCKKFVNDANKQVKKTIIIFDSQDEYYGKYHIYNVPDFIQHISERGLEKEIYVFKSNDQEENEDMFDVVVGLENCLIVVEECSKFSKPQGIYYSFKNIINYGRHNKLTYLAIARRPAEIHKDIISNSHIVVTFQQILPSDIKLLNEFGFSDNLRILDQFNYELKKYF